MYSTFDNCVQQNWINGIGNNVYFLFKGFAINSSAVWELQAGELRQMLIIWLLGTATITATITAESVNEVRLKLGQSMKIISEKKSVRVQYNIFQDENSAPVAKEASDRYTDTSQLIFILWSSC